MLCLFFRAGPVGTYLQGKGKLGNLREARSKTAASLVWKAAEVDFTGGRVAASFRLPIVPLGNYRVGPSATDLVPGLTFLTLL